MSYLEKLLNISSDSLSIDLRSTNIPTKLNKVYSNKNGFVCFEGAFRFLPITQEFDRNLYSWNSFISKDINVKTKVFFADNILGDGFCIYNDIFYKYDFESGELEFMGTTLEEFCKELLLNYNYYVGYSILDAWQSNYSEVSFNKVLMTKLPFVLGGGYQISNFFLDDIYNSISIKNDIFCQLKDYKDGEQIKFILS